MEVVTVGRLGGSTAEGVTLGRRRARGCRCGSRSSRRCSACPALRHRSGEAASAGAALLAGKALGMGLTLDQLDPVEAVIEPDPAAVEIYRGLRPQVDHVAAVRPGRHRVAPRARPPRALTRARRPRLRPPRDVGRGARQRRGRGPGRRAGSRRRGRRRSRDALRAPAGRAAAGRPGGAGGTGGRRLPRPDPAHAEPHRAPAAARRAGPLRGARRPDRRCCAPPGPIVRPPGRRWRSSSGPTSWPATT